jgi:hypothetical protein
VLSQICKKDGELHPVAYLSRSLFYSERNYKVFDKEVLAIIAAFKEWRQYLEGSPHRLTAIVYTNHRNLEGFMTTKQLTRRQARWAKTMGCFDFEIIFRPGRQSTKPDALSRRPNLAPSKEDKLIFGQLLRLENITPHTFAEVATFEIDKWFVDKTIPLDDSDHWFLVDIMGMEELETNTFVEGWTDVDLISQIWEASKFDKRIADLISDCVKSGSGGDSSTTDGVLYHCGQIKFPSVELIKQRIVQSRHDRRLAGHLGRSKTLVLVQQCFTWPLVKKYVNQYVDGCDSCQRVKPSLSKPFGTLEPLPIPAGPWTDISYNMITNLPESRGFDCILTVIDWLTKMAHFLPCNKSMTADQLADLMLRHVWKLHGTPKTIFLDRGSIFCHS